ncbi:MAG: DUF975 family protein [Clostridia bacterium]|nr:DUF975 family protein [Clostridia bacterium]
MKAKDYRKAAWGKLSGNWSTMVVAYLVLGAIVAAATMLAGVGEFIVAGPLLLGFSMMTIAIVRGNKTGIENLFDGFKTNFVQSLILYILNTIFTALWSLLFVIPGIIAQYRYSMSYYILNDHPEMTANEARKASIELMKGNKWKLFCLHFSFIGWIILCGLTFGILTLWIQPYMETANAEFYESIKK